MKYMMKSRSEEIGEKRLTVACNYQPKGFSLDLFIEPLFHFMFFYPFGNTIVQ